MLNLFRVINNKNRDVIRIYYINEELKFLTQHTLFDDDQNFSILFEFVLNLLYIPYLIMKNVDNNNVEDVLLIYFRQIFLREHIKLYIIKNLFRNRHDLDIYIKFFHNNNVLIIVVRRQFIITQWSVQIFIRIKSLNFLRGYVIDFNRRVESFSRFSFSWKSS